MSLERPATLSESSDVSALQWILLRECMCEAITVLGSFVSVNKSVMGLDICKEETVKGERKAGQLCSEWR